MSLAARSFPLKDILVGVRCHHQVWHMRFSTAHTRGIRAARGWAVVQRRRCAAKVKAIKAPGAAAASAKHAEMANVQNKPTAVLTNAAEGHGGDEANVAGVAVSTKHEEKRVAVTDLKFSPDGTNLVACCMDKSIYVFAADGGYKR